MHSPSVKFLAISLTEAMGHFFRDVDQSVPAGMPLDAAAPLLQDVVARHGITIGQWPS